MLYALTFVSFNRGYEGQDLDMILDVHQGGHSATHQGLDLQASTHEDLTTIANTVHVHYICKCNILIIHIIELLAYLINCLHLIFDKLQVELNYQKLSKLEKFRSAKFHIIY
jgi:hypothetical protein